MEQKVLEIINKMRNVKGLEPIAQLTPKNSLRKDLNMQSLDLAELTVRIEDEFDVDIFEDGFVDTLEEVFSKLSK